MTLIKPPCFNGETSAKEINEWLAEVTNRDSAAIAKANATKDNSTAVWSINGNIESDLDHVVIKNNTTNVEMTGEELIQELQFKFMNQSFDASVDTAKAIVEHLKQNPFCTDDLTALMHDFKI